MKLLDLKLLFFVGILFSFTLSSLASESTIERILSVDIDGETYKIPLNIESKVSVNNKIRNIKITIDDTSKFNGYGLQFLFPSKMTANFDDNDPNVKIWSIDGDAALIMVQRYETPVELKSFIGRLVAYYKNMKADVSTEKETFKGRYVMIDGTNIIAKLGDITIVQKVFLSRHRGGATLLILQDTINKKNHSKEFLKIEKVIKQSLKITI